MAKVCSDLMYIVPMLWEAQIRIGSAKWPIYLYEYKYVNDIIFPKRIKTHGKNADMDKISINLCSRVPWL
jgi:hypothetical protein